MKQIQKQIKEFCKEHNLDASVENRMLDLVSEIGEASKEILKATNYGKKKAKFDGKIEEELGDAFFSLVVLANELDVDLENSLNKALKKYEKRLEKGSAGSGV